MCVCVYIMHHTSCVRKHTHTPRHLHSETLLPLLIGQWWSGLKGHWLDRQAVVLASAAEGDGSWIHDWLVASVAAGQVMWSCDITITLIISNSGRTFQWNSKNKNKWSNLPQRRCSHITARKTKTLGHGECVNPCKLTEQCSFKTLRIKNNSPVVTAQAGRGRQVLQRPQGFPTGSAPYRLWHRLHGEGWESEHEGRFEAGGRGGGAAKPQVKIRVTRWALGGRRAVREVPSACDEVQNPWLAVMLTAECTNVTSC